MNGIIVMNSNQKLEYVRYLQKLDLGFTKSKLDSAKDKVIPTLKTDSGRIRCINEFPEPENPFTYIWKLIEDFHNCRLKRDNSERIMLLLSALMYIADECIPDWHVYLDHTADFNYTFDTLWDDFNGMYHLEPKDFVGNINALINLSVFRGDIKGIHSVIAHLENIPVDKIAQT